MLGPTQMNFTGFHNLYLPEVNNISFPIYIHSLGTAHDNEFLLSQKKYRELPIPISFKGGAPFFGCDQNILPIGQVKVKRL